ncbi:MAG: hypothetical protein CM15mP89_3870 [Gammaproteobacteria bacterium]|nr:MAG: hypothetical protein CM15mP89_3870 [Gammaproteobacteria bacterium]
MPPAREILGQGIWGFRRAARPEDRSNFSCALRETEEELGVDLSRWGAPLGELSDVNTGWRKDRPEMLVTPFIFSVSAVTRTHPNDEVDEWCGCRCTFDG